MYFQCFLLVGFALNMSVTPLVYRISTPDRQFFYRFNQLILQVDNYHKILVVFFTDTAAAAHGRHQVLQYFIVYMPLMSLYKLH